MTPGPCRRYHQDFIVAINHSGRDQEDLDTLFQETGDQSETPPVELLGPGGRDTCSHPPPLLPPSTSSILVTFSPLSHSPLPSPSCGPRLGWIQGLKMRSLAFPRVLPDKIDYRLSPGRYPTTTASTRLLVCVVLLDQESWGNREMLHPAYRLDSSWCERQVRRAHLTS